jgi:hypothetical protein
MHHDHVDAMSFRTSFQNTCAFGDLPPGGECGPQGAGAHCSRLHQSGAGTAPVGVLLSLEGFCTFKTRLSILCTVHCVGNQLHAANGSHMLTSMVGQPLQMPVYCHVCDTRISPVCVQYGPAAWLNNIPVAQT